MIDLSAGEIEPAKFRRQLLSWYDAHARDLPWRRTEDAYAIWVSEIMLQQTQVKTVLGYFDRFLVRFPTVEALAKAQESEVLEIWAGLGYYRRARQMHLAAKKILAEFNGVFPTDAAEILGLPGIGRYTAGAIASFAFDDRQPIVEANTARLHARLLAIEEPLASGPVQKRLWNLAEYLLPPGRGTRQLNQALMELGSQVCQPDRPQCMLCPVKQHCMAHRLGKQDQVPVIKPKEKPTPLVHALVVIRRENKVLLRQAAAGQWWEGLWEFPRLDLTAIAAGGPEAPSTRVVSESLDAEYSIASSGVEYLTAFTHAVTRYRIRANCYTASTDVCENVAEPLAWHDANRMPPLSSPAKKLWKILHTDSTK